MATTADYRGDTIPAHDRGIANNPFLDRTQLARTEDVWGEVFRAREEPGPDETVLPNGMGVRIDHGNGTVVLELKAEGGQARTGALHALDVEIEREPFVVYGLENGVIPDFSNPTYRVRMEMTVESARQFLEFLEGAM